MNSHRILLRASLLLLAVNLIGPSVSAAHEQTDYEKRISLWRIERESRLTSDTGYLTVAGLFWLVPGDNTFGSAPDNALILPAGTAPAHAGSFRLEKGPDGDFVRVNVESGVRVTHEKQPVTTRVLTPDIPGPVDELRMGRLTLWVINRKGRLGIRLRDTQAKLRYEFAGLEFYDVNESYRVTGRWRPFNTPHPVVFGNEVGYIDTTLAYGEVAFEFLGESLTLTPQHMAPGDSSLFFVMADATTGAETYSGGRFLTAKIEPSGEVVIDFNKAYNPPCAFNPWTTCPFPAEENRFDFPIHAGEKEYRPAVPEGELGDGPDEEAGDHSH